MRKTLLSLCLGPLLAAPAIAAPAEISAQAWLETYYLNPQPAELPRAILRLSRDGYFDQPAHVAIAIGFISTVFEKHPTQVDGWLLQLRDLPPAHRRLLAAALWQSGHADGAVVLEVLGQSAPNRDAVVHLARTPPRTIEDTTVLSPSSMNLHWGAFLASGDESHIVSILDAFGSDLPALGNAARMALAQNAAAHPRVMDICRAQLDKQPEEIRSVLRAAILSATANRHGS